MSFSPSNNVPYSSPRPTINLMRRMGPPPPNYYPCQHMPVFIPQSQSPQVFYREMENVYPPFSQYQPTLLPPLNLPQIPVETTSENNSVQSEPEKIQLEPLNETPEEKLARLILENEKLKSDKLCVICLENEKNILFQPCCHLSTCPSCSVYFNTCPICRVPVYYKLKIFA